MDTGEHMNDMICNSDTGAWVRLCADLTYEAAPPFQATLPGIDHISQEFQHAAGELGMGPLEPDRLSSCDCCGKRRVCRPANHPSIETSACAECTGANVCEICLDDADYCDCQAASEDDKREETYERPTCVNPQTGALEVA